MNGFRNIKVYNRTWKGFMVLLLAMMFSTTSLAQDTNISDNPDSTLEASPVLDSTIVELADTSEVSDAVEDTSATEETPVEETVEEEEPAQVEEPIEEPLVSITNIEETPVEEVVPEVKPKAPIPLFKPTLGIGGGLFTYFGDLKAYKYSSRIIDNLGYDFTISTRINKYLTLGLYFIKGKITTD
ncbi:MAG: hypothetical protein COB85_07915, partial [Bacteroidetes bacterium]